MTRKGKITGTESGLTIKELKGSRMKQNCTDHRQGKHLKKRERAKERMRGHKVLLRGMRKMLCLEEKAEKMSRNQT